MNFLIEERKWERKRDDALIAKDSLTFAGREVKCIFTAGPAGKNFQRTNMWN